MGFIIPLVLSIMAFMSATYNNHDAFVLLIISHIMLLLNCSLVMLQVPKSSALGFFYFHPSFFRIRHLPVFYRNLPKAVPSFYYFCSIIFAS